MNDAVEYSIKIQQADAHWRVDVIRRDGSVVSSEWRDTYSEAMSLRGKLTWELQRPSPPSRR